MEIKREGGPEEGEEWGGIFYFFTSALSDSLNKKQTNKKTNKQRLPDQIRTYRATEMEVFQIAAHLAIPFLNRLSYANYLPSPPSISVMSGLHSRAPSWLRALP